jgi:hypothetical protein
VREAAGVVPLALEFLQALELRHVCGRQATHGRDEVTCRDLFSLVGAHGPKVGSLIEFAVGDSRVELHVAFQVVAFGHVLKITEDFGLLRIAFRPFPLLQ